MGIGQRPFHLPLADTHPEKAAFLNGVGGIAKLGARIDIRGQKPVNPAGKVFGTVIRQHRARANQTNHPKDQHKGRSGDEIHHTPAKQHQHRLAEIRLQRQKAYDNQCDTKRNQLAGRSANLLACRHQPGGQNDETRLQKF